MKEDRVAERQEAIRTGQIADPNVPMRLEDAIDFRGTCMTMCPAFELVEREVQNMLDTLETVSRLYINYIHMSGRIYNI